MSRKPPLHTIGASALAIIHIASTRAKEANGPVGTFSKRVNAMMSSGLPFIYTMQYQWLSILLFADDYILTVETVAEKIFPPAVGFFDGFDRLLCKTESLPKQFDDALNTWPVIMHENVLPPFLDWALVHLISWLNFLISNLTLMGSKSTKQKDIMVDASSDNTKTPSKSAESGKQSADRFPGKTTYVHEIEDFGGMDPKTNIETETETKSVEKSRPDSTEMKKSGGMKHGTRIKSTMKSTYKEVLLEKGRKEEEKEREKKAEMAKEKDGVKKNNSPGPFSFNLNDPILELYESSWHLK